MAKVYVGVLNGWCCYLNLNERYRSRTSPKRLFITTCPTIGTVVEPSSEWDDGRAMEVFHERMVDELKYYENFKWDNFNLVFFTMYASDHYYVVCFDFLKTMIHVIDNVRSAADVETRYGNQISKLTDYFIHSLEKFSCSSYGRMARKAKIDVLEMKWQTKEDTTDCGVFTMRHMETFMGMKACEWKCDLTNKNSKAFQLLRAKYCTSMLYSNDNLGIDYAMHNAINQYEEGKKKGPLDVEKMVADFHKS